MFGQHQKIAMSEITIPCAAKTQPVSSETVAEVQPQLAWDKFGTIAQSSMPTVILSYPTYKYISSVGLECQCLHYGLAIYYQQRKRGPTKF